MKQRIIFTLFILFSPVFTVFAQTLENIPGQTPAGEGDLIGYLNNLYKFGISITGILAIFMIGLGAFAYIVTSAGNSSKMIDAKEKIQNALIGLVIALTAYLLLYVINPDLVGGTLTAPKTAVDNIVSPDASSTEIGCCLYSYNSQCNPSATRTFCDGQGTSSFSVGDNFMCSTVEGSSSVKKCVISNNPVVPASSTDMGCCTFPENQWTNGCNSSISRFDCENITGGEFVPGTDFVCVGKQAGTGFVRSCVDNNSNP